MRKLITITIISALCSVIVLQADVPQVHVLTSDGNFYSLEGEINAAHTPSTVELKASDDIYSINLTDIQELIFQQVAVPEMTINIPGNPDLYQLQDKDTYLDAKIAIEGNGYIVDLSECDVTVKGRGNSTWSMPKKPMRLKFAKKTSLAGLKKAKNWVLLANYIDPSLMRNALAFWLASELGIPYANHIVPVNVTFNGHSLGSFTLTEKLGINAGSVDIDETTGILLELSTEYDEKYKFYSSTYRLPVMFKDPDFDELAEDDPSWGTADAHFSTWQAEYNEAEKLVRQGRGFDAFDLDTFVDYILLNNIVLNSEIGFPKSVYIHKVEPGSGCKWQFGPAWDFDVTFNLASDGATHSAQRPYTDELWVNSLFSDLIDTQGFIERYQERYQYFKDEIYPRWLEFFDQYSSLVHPSALANGTIWTEPYDTGWCIAVPSSYHTSEISDLRQWIENRIQWLDQRIASGNL